MLKGQMPQGLMDDNENQEPPDQAGSQEETAQGEQQAQAGGADQSQDEGEGDQPQGQKATPQQQAQYDQFVNNAYHLIYKGGTPNPAVLKMLSAGDHVHGLAAATVEVVMRLLNSAQDKGVKPDPGVLFHGGKEIYQDLADLSDKAKIHKFTDGELSAGWIQTMDLARVRMTHAGMIDPKAFQRDVEEMKKAEAEGKLDEVLPGVGPIAQRAAAAQQQRGQQQQQQPAPGGAGPQDQQQGGGLLE